MQNIFLDSFVFNHTKTLLSKQVGFFPSECVEVIGDKVPPSMANCILMPGTTGTSPVATLMNAATPATARKPCELDTSLDSPNSQCRLFFMLCLHARCWCLPSELVPLTHLFWVLRSHFVPLCFISKEKLDSVVFLSLRFIPLPPPHPPSRFLWQKCTVCLTRDIDEAWLRA